MVGGNAHCSGASPGQDPEWVDMSKFEDKAVMNALAILLLADAGGQE